MDTDQKTEQKTRPGYLRPLHEIFDTNYRYQHRVSIEDPYDDRTRRATSEHIRRIFDLADVRDYKLIENSPEFLVLLKHRYDHSHFALAYEKDQAPAANRRFNFILPDKLSAYPSEIWKVKRHFRQAAESAGLDRAIRVTADLNKKSVTVHSRSLDEYFEFWRHVPENRRLRISSHPG